MKIVIIIVILFRPFFFSTWLRSKRIWRRVILSPYLLSNIWYRLNNPAEKSGQDPKDISENSKAFDHHDDIIHKDIENQKSELATNAFWKDRQETILKDVGENKAKEIKDKVVSDQVEETKIELIDTVDSEQIEEIGAAIIENHSWQLAKEIITNQYNYQVSNWNIIVLKYKLC